MFVPKIDHITVTVKNFEESKKFYIELLVNYLGFTLDTAEKDFLIIDCKGGFLFELSAEDPQYATDSFDRFRVGLHHFAITLENKQAIDNLYQKILEMKVEILDSPQFYPNYAENYYGLYFKDLNGFKMEFLTYV